MAGGAVQEIGSEYPHHSLRHGDFHNIAFLLLFATAAALVLRLAGMRFGDSFLFAGIGFGARKPKNERFFGQ